MGAKPPSGEPLRIFFEAAGLAAFESGDFFTVFDLLDCGEPTDAAIMPW